jgi:hypothetical protein
MHLAMNSLVLFFVGFALERQIGRAWLAALFIISGIGGSLMSITLNPPTAPSVGASGAIMGLLAAMFVFTFRQSSGAGRWAERLNLLRFIIPALLPAAAEKHIDVAGHLGGAIAGAIVGILIVAAWPRNLALPRLRPLAAGIAAASLLILPIGLRSGVAVAYFVRGNAAQSERDALAYYDRAIAVSQKFAGAIRARGIMRFTQAKYDDAAADFQANMRSAWDPVYDVLLLDLSRAHAGVEDAGELSGNAARIDLAQWPGPIVGLFLDKTSLAAIPRRGDGGR